MPNSAQDYVNLLRNVKEVHHYDITVWYMAPLIAAVGFTVGYFSAMLNILLAY